MQGEEIMSSETKLCFLLVLLALLVGCQAAKPIETPGRVQADGERSDPTPTPAVESLAEGVTIPG